MVRDLPDWSMSHFCDGSKQIQYICLWHICMYSDCPFIVAKSLSMIFNIGARLLSYILMIGGIIMVDDRSKWWVWSHNDHTFVQAVWRGGALFKNPPYSLSSFTSAQPVWRGESCLALARKGSLSEGFIVMNLLDPSNGKQSPLFWAWLLLVYIISVQMMDTVTSRIIRIMIEGGNYLSNCQCWRVRRGKDIAIVVSPLYCWHYRRINMR